MDFLSPTQGLKILKEECTSGKNQEITINIQHQLNYVLVKKFGNSVKDVQTLPGADNDLLVAIISTRQ